MELRVNSRQKGSDVVSLVGVAAVTTLGQYAVDMPYGYFGPAGQATVSGSIFAAAIAILAGLAAWLRWYRVAGAGVGAALLTTMALVSFIPALASDWLLATVLAGWLLVMAARLLLPWLAQGNTGAEVEATPALPDELQQWLWASGPAARDFLVLTIVVTTAVVGLELVTGLLPWIICVTLNVTSVIFHGELLVLLFRAGRRSVALLALLLAAAALLLFQPEWSLSLLVAHQVIVLVLLVSRGPVFAELLAHFLRHPALLAMVSFAGLILMGALVLSFPAAAGAGPISFIDALFTAVSAVCVTGLVVLDTPHDFSLFGQVVILGLIQVGGLGIMVISSFAALMLGGKLGLRSRQALVQTLDLQSTHQAYTLTLFIVVTTLIIEALGAVSLGWAFASRGHRWGEALWRGLFHSISAFCNAGFALQSDSLAIFQRDPWALLVVALLITLGGLGFFVLAATLNRVRRRTRRLSTQVKIVLSMSAILTLSGFVVILLFEWHGSLAGLPWLDKLVNAFFQSVTLRTAGFSSVSFSALNHATVVVMLLLMFVGASPGGTGGGIKTTTFAVLLGCVRATARGEIAVIAFGRRISQAIVYRSIAIAVIWLGVAGTTLMVLALTQSLSFEKLSFEVFSAMGTVGLSLGTTTELNPIGKLMISGAMFVGRLGPLTLALLFGHSRDTRFLYPESRIMVG